MCFSPISVRLFALYALFAAALPAAQAQLYWAGSAGTVATAGAGNWDPNTSIHWRDSTPTGTLVKWTNNQTAIFQGTAGGAVAVSGSLSVSALQFSAAAGPFVFTSSSGTMNFTGAGISSASTNDQNLNFQAAALNFATGSSAGSGPQGSHIRITVSGDTTFNGTATAGSATINNNGLMIFGDQSSLGTAVVNNTNQLTLRGSATAGVAAITNSGILNFEGDAHNFASAAFTNNGGSLDISAVTSLGGVTFGALTNSAGSILALGPNRLAVGSLNLIDGDQIYLNLGASLRGIVVTTSILGNLTAGGTQIGIDNAGSLTAGQKFTLIDWSGATTVTGVQESDFSLIGVFNGNLKIENSKLVLEVLPEPGTMASLLVGAFCLGLRRQRQRR